MYEQRRVNLCAALDHIVENAENASVTADSVIRAIRAYSRLTPAGQWIEPPAQVVFSVARPGVQGSGDQSQVPKLNLQLPAPSIEQKTGPPSVDGIQGSRVDGKSSSGDQSTLGYQIIIVTHVD
jgi:hypothetical protein